MREAINRATSQTSQRVTRKQEVANLELQAILKHRHIKIFVQLEFDEDRECLQNFKILLTSSRDHIVTLNINLGYIDSHGPFGENGLVFKKDEPEMKRIVTEILSWKNPRCALNMSHLTGCICGGNNRFPSIKHALDYLEETTKANKVPFKQLEGFPKGWPRWQIEPYRPSSWTWSRSRVIRRLGLQSA
jgi:hypothetical protein